MDSIQNERDHEIRVREIDAGAGGLRALIVAAEGADVVPLSTGLVPVAGIVVDESGTRPKGPHFDIDAPAP